MYWTAGKLLSLWPLALCAFLAGCFEVDTSANFYRQGQAKVKVEFAVSAELMAFAANPQFQKDGQSPVDWFDKCGEETSSSQLPDGVKSVRSTSGQRSGMFTCTIDAEVIDPIAAIKTAREKQSGGPDLSIEKLHSADGYRIQATIAPPADGPFSSDKPEDGFANSVAIAMFANRFITITLQGLRIENHNGELSEDQTKAVWKIPLLGVIGPGAKKPFEIKADVIYAEPWYIGLKRKLFG